MRKGVFRSTQMDAQGRVFLPANLRRRLNLTAAKSVEFYTTAGGEIAIRNPETKKYNGN